MLILAPYARDAWNMGPFYQQTRWWLFDSRNHYFFDIPIIHESNLPIHSNEMAHLNKVKENWHVDRFDSCSRTSIFVKMQTTMNSTSKESVIFVKLCRFINWYKYLLLKAEVEHYFKFLSAIVHAAADVLFSPIGVKQPSIYFVVFNPNDHVTQTLWFIPKNYLSVYLGFSESV